ncbi:SDR family oxidoreductase [Winogradskyella sp. PC D3.3]
MNKTIFITGASSGIGKATAIHFQKKGWNVVATMRNTNSGKDLAELQNVLVTRLDVTDSSSIQSAVKAAVQKFETIDVLLNNAGYGMLGTLEATPIATIREQYNVNVIGLLETTQTVLPIMRKQKSGTIVNISSMGGRIALPLGSVYGATKYAVEGISEALQYELEPLGITVKIIEPGVITSNFSKSVAFNDENISDYKVVVDKIMKTYKGEETNDTFPGSAPNTVAKVIDTAIHDTTNQLRFPAGNDAEQMLEARAKLSDGEMIAMLKENFGI